MPCQSISSVCCYCGTRILKAILKFKTQCFKVVVVLLTSLQIQRVNKLDASTGDPQAEKNPQIFVKYLFTLTQLVKILSMHWIHKHKKRKRLIKDNVQNFLEGKAFKVI